MYYEMLEDSTRAIELDDQYVKAFAANGEALVMIGVNQKDMTRI